MPFHHRMILIKIPLSWTYNGLTIFIIFVTNVRNCSHLFIVACGMHNLRNNSSLGNFNRLPLGSINGDGISFCRFWTTLIFSNMIYLFDLPQKTQVDSVISSQLTPVATRTGRVHNQVKVKPTRTLNISLFRLCWTRFSRVLTEALVASVSAKQTW